MLDCVFFEFPKCILKISIQTLLNSFSKFLPPELLQQKIVLLCHGGEGVLGGGGVGPFLIILKLTDRFIQLET